MMQTQKEQRLVLIGCGFAGSTHWIPSISGSAPFEIVGLVDPDREALMKAKEIVPNAFTCPGGPEEITGLYSPGEDIAFIATPDHFPVIKQAVQRGFRNFIIEKPLVTRESEIDLLLRLIKEKSLQVYSIDHYYMKFLALQHVLRGLGSTDPRAEWLVLNARADHSFISLSGCLGRIEGVTYTNIEAGDLGLPTLDTCPWMEHDPEIGGMIRDLGPHAFAPLLRCGLLKTTPSIFHVSLDKLAAGRRDYSPVRERDDVDMFVQALLVSDGVTANVTFGKAPFEGKERSLAVRGEKGLFLAGLGRGQDSVVLSNDGKTSRISLVKAENDLVLEEAMLYFNNQLPGFDGNVAFSCGAITLGETVREHYYRSLE